MDARKFTKTVQLLLNASKASLCIDVFGGRTPFANREIMVRGRARSCSKAFSICYEISHFKNHPPTSTLDPSRAARPVGAGDSSSPFVTVERFDFLPGMVAIEDLFVAKFKTLADM